MASKKEVEKLYKKAEYLCELRGVVIIMLFVIMFFGLFFLYSWSNYHPMDENLFCENKLDYYFYDYDLSNIYYDTTFNNQKVTRYCYADRSVGDKIQRDGLVLNGQTEEIKFEIVGKEDIKHLKASSNGAGFWMWVFAFIIVILILATLFIYFDD